ncbi:MAG: hypothetical protein HY657_02380 [Acidobacteria bacterium]|nr:hypothetical protein [Acidobacteriota bacterium]
MAGGVPFQIERSELNIQLPFSRPFWPIANNIALLYSGLLNHLREFGVTPQGIRPDAADGSLGAFNVNFWLLQFGVLARIRLESIELNAPTFNVDVDRLERAFLGLDRALREAERDLAYANYAVTVGMHGHIGGLEAKDFLARFASNVPQGLGTPVGSGTVFYFESQSPATLVVLTADLSAVVAGGVYVKLHTVFDGSMSPENLRRSAEKSLEQGIAALGLEVSAGQ